MSVESSHHQAVRRLGRGLLPTAVSPDGVIETLERPDRRFALGFQWHPEIDACGGAVAHAFVDATMEQAA